FDEPMLTPDPRESYRVLPAPPAQNTRAQPAPPDPQIASCRRCIRSYHPAPPGMDVFLSIRVLSVLPDVFLRPEPAPIAAGPHRQLPYTVSWHPLLTAMPGPPWALRH